MNDALRYIAYLCRYPLALLAILTALLLVVRALLSLRRRIRQQMTPAHGFFLMSQVNKGGDIVQSYSLYHTTTIGRTKSSDIRLRGKNVAARHALIYLYQGKWLIRPAAGSADVICNGKRVVTPRRLKHEDLIQIGPHTIVFIDERISAEERGIDYEYSLSEWQSDRLPELPISTWFPWLLICLFQIIGFAVIVILMPEEFHPLRPILMILLTGYFGLSQIGYFSWGRLFQQFDRAIYSGFVFLGSVGLIIQGRFAFIGRVKPDAPEWTQDVWLSFVQRDFLVQAGVALLGLILLPIIVTIVAKTNFLEKISVICLVLTPLLYLATLVLGRGREQWGANLWIRLPGGLSLQLTEFAKITYLIVLALFFKNRPPLKTQLLFGLWAGFNFALIMLLPDLGSMMILLPVTLVVFVVMTSEYIKTAMILLGGSLIFLAAYHLLSYVQNRLYGWLTLWTETNAANEQIIFGLQAIGRGGVLGRGLGVGNPRSIPLASSDMVFAVIAEEMGILICLAIVLIFIMIWLRGANAVSRVRDGFTSSLILATATYFFIEAAIVIGGTTGLIPLTGATLPLIAKGGSSMIAKWMLAGILLGLCCRNEEGAYLR